MFAVRRLVQINSFFHHVGRAAAGELQLSVVLSVHNAKGMRSAIQYAGQLIRSTQAQGQVHAQRYYSTESTSGSPSPPNDENTTGSTQILSSEQPNPNKDKSNKLGSSGEKVNVVKHPVSPFSLYYRAMCSQLKKELGGPASTWMAKAKLMFDELPFEEKMKYYDEFQLRSEAIRVAKSKLPRSKPTKLTKMDKIKLLERKVERSRNRFKRSQTILGFPDRVRQRIPAPYSMYVADRLRGTKGRLVNMRSIAVQLSKDYASLDPATISEYRARARKLYEADREILLKYKEWRAAIDLEYETQLQNPNWLKNDDAATKAKRKRLKVIERYLLAEKRILQSRAQLKSLRQALKEKKSAATGKESETDSKRASPKRTRKKSTSSKTEAKSKRASDKLKTESKAAQKAKKKIKKVKATQQKQKKARKKPTVESDEYAEITT